LVDYPLLLQKPAVFGLSACLGAYSISRSIQPFPVRRPVGWSGRREGEAPATPIGVWTIMRLMAGLVPRPPGGRIISVSIWKWN
jgi:hypothetical protein